MLREHYALVKRITPVERLLVFSLSDGWGPLCAFLGKGVPNVPFPRVNDTDAMTEKMKLVAWRKFSTLRKSREVPRLVQG